MKYNKHIFKCKALFLTAKGKVFYIIFKSPIFHSLKQYFLCPKARLVVLRSITVIVTNIKGGFFFLGGKEGKGEMILGDKS